MKKKGTQNRRSVKSTPAKVATLKKKGTQNRRSIDSTPASCKQVKDCTASRKLSVCAQHIKELQHCTTWQDGENKPKFHACMMVYDELRTRPDQGKDESGDYFRYDKNGKKSPRINILVPKGDNRKGFASVLEKIAIEMKTSDSNSGEDWTFEDDSEAFFHHIYGDKKFNVQGDNKQKKRNKNAY